MKGETATLVQADEAVEEAAPAKVDVAKLFATLEIVAMREVSLTGSHAASERAWPNREWRAGGPFFNIPPELLLNPNATWEVPEGFDHNGTWLGVPPVQPAKQRVSRLHGPHSARKAARFPSADFESFDANDRTHRGWFGTHLVVELVPLEIRTFEILVERKSTEQK